MDACMLVVIVDMVVIILLQLDAEEDHLLLPTNTNEG